MAYVTLEFYTNTYFGSPISAEDFPRYEARAEEIIESLTDYKISETGFDNFEEKIQLLIKKAVSAQVEYFVIEGIEAASTGITNSSASVSISGFSYSGSDGASGMARRVGPSVYSFLYKAGLLRKRGMKIGTI